MSSALQIALGGKAVVCCVHDHPKRELVTEAQVAELGASVGLPYDPVQHKLHLCACCENLFIDASDVPRFCHRCRPSRLVHPLGGPLPEPKGAVA